MVVNHLEKVVGCGWGEKSQDPAAVLALLTEVFLPDIDS